MVDDDFRNVFALTSLLERCEVEVISPQSGAGGLDILEATPDIDIVLMDIMMPVMDGYATMRAIRAATPTAELPIIAVTGNAEAGSASAASTRAPPRMSPSPSTPPSCCSSSANGSRRTCRPESRPWCQADGGRSADRGAGDLPAPPADVLVVDDNAGKRLAVRAMLAPLGYAVVEADSGRAALQAIKRQNFAVILMDVGMPVLDGYETARLIRLRTESRALPIIFLTAFRRDETETAAAYANGAVDFIFTPVARRRAAREGLDLRPSLPAVRGAPELVGLDHGPEHRDALAPRRGRRAP